MLNRHQSLLLFGLTQIASTPGGLALLSGEPLVIHADRHAGATDIDDVLASYRDDFRKPASFPEDPYPYTSNRQVGPKLETAHFKRETPSDKRRRLRRAGKPKSDSDGIVVPAPSRN